MPAGRISTATVLLALLWVCCVPVTPAGSSASWGGRVFETDRSSPRAGVVVRLVDTDAEQSIASAPTREDGAFSIADATPGSYELHVETPEGTFVSGQPVQLAPGNNTPMALALQARPFNAKQEKGIGKELSRRSEWIFAGVVTLVSLFIYLEVTDDQTEQSSTVF